jgi:hypothetical protein
MDSQACQVVLDQGRSLNDSMGKKCYKRYKGPLISCHLILPFSDSSSFSTLGPAFQGSRLLPSHFLMFHLYTPG